MQTILVPLDGSPLSEQVLPYVRLLAPILAANVRLLHVITEVDREGIITSGTLRPYGPAGALVTYGELAPRAWDFLRANAEAYLAALAAPLSEAGLVVEVDVQAGAPADRIVEGAEQRDVALIAMATHGYGGLRRWALGSVTDRVIHATTTPLFIVRSAAHVSPGDHALTRILLPLDGSDLARQALPLAIELAKRAHAELVVLRAVEPYSQYASLLIMQRTQAAQDLHALAAELRQQQVVVTPIVAIGSAAEAIINEAAQRGVDLIVMATHGYGGLQRWALGSVADKVLQAAPMPILLVRAQPSTGEQQTTNRQYTVNV